MWERREGGYFIVADEMVKMAIDFNEEMERKKAECAERGEHIPQDGEREETGGWVTCRLCDIPLEHPEGGPVALPGGGLLGPDPRES
ncbi:MAG TPA: hypothetical protein VGL39_18295 [Jatrophihabitantaceae bacterium]|jgi:hypothetical protein